MTNDVSGTGTETGTASPGPAGSPPETAAQQRPRRWWPITIVAVVAALVAGVLAQRTIDHHRAVITTYRVQVESTLARLGADTSPYAESTIALWDIRLRGTSNQGVCVLTSSLAGNGRVTEDVQLGGHIFLQPCLSSWWAPGPVDGSQPRLSLANIHEPPR
jgi:hypothetical protein